MQFNLNLRLSLVAALLGIVAAQDSVTLCHDTNYNGGCVPARDNRNRCINVGSGDNDNISSVLLGPNTACRFWADNNCQGASITIRTNTPDLQAVGFNDVISSFTCFPP